MMQVLTRIFGTLLLLGTTSVVVVNAQEPPRRTPVYIVPVRERSRISEQLDRMQRNEELQTLQRNLEWARQSQLRQYEHLEIPERPQTPLVIKIPVLRRNAPRTEMEVLKITARNRVEAAREIYDLSIWSINRVVEQLQDDLVKLRQSPFAWESEYEKQRKLEEIKTFERNLARLEQQAREEANAGTNVVRNSNGTIELKNDGALRQLRDIQINGWPRR